MREPTADEVASRLEWLRAAYVPESVDEGRARLARGEREARASEPFAQAVERGLKELRALCDLAAHLHDGRIGE